MTATHIGGRSPRTTFSRPTAARRNRASRIRRARIASFSGSFARATTTRATRSSTSTPPKATNRSIRSDPASATGGPPRIVYDLFTAPRVADWPIYCVLEPELNGAGKLAVDLFVVNLLRNHDRRHPERQTATLVRHQDITRCRQEALDTWVTDRTS